MTNTAWATTISASDTLSDSRAVINTNFNAARRWTVAEIDNTASPYTAGDVDLIACDCTSGAITVNLPAPSSAGDAYVVIKTDASGNAVTIDGAASNTINGATTRTLSSQWDVVQIVWTGSEWVEV